MVAAAPDCFFAPALRGTEEVGWESGSTALSTGRMLPNSSATPIVWSLPNGSVLSLDAATPPTE